MVSDDGTFWSGIRQQEEILWKGERNWYSVCFSRPACVYWSIRRHRWPQRDGEIVAGKNEEEEEEVQADISSCGVSLFEPETNPA